ncbi:hypothetical protein JCM11251_002770 [Rhodosporidiobolus azoricus]
MAFSRACSACVQSVRAAVRPTVLPAPRFAVRQLHSTSPLLKKGGKKQAEAFDEFEEDNFEDDVDAELEASAATPIKTGASRSERFDKYRAVVQKTLATPDHTLKTTIPSQRELANLVAQASVEELPEALELLARWRAKGLAPLSDKTVTLLAQRLAQVVEEDGGVKGVEVFADRTTYGVDLPSDLKGLYPLFAKLSRPQSAARSPAPAAEAAEPVEAAEEATPSETPSPAAGSSSSSPSSLSFVSKLYDTALLHQPTQTSTDALILLTTLSAFSRAGDFSSPLATQLVSQIQKTGEEALVQQARDVGRKWRYIVRMRSRVVAEAMREKAHPEVEWFSHLAESLHGVAANWTRGRNQESSEQDLEAGNDDQLHALRSKITSIRGVTQDIYEDSRAQNGLLDGTSNAMDSFKASLANTSQRFTRLVQNRQGQVNYALLIPAGVVVLFVLYKLFGGRGGSKISDSQIDQSVGGL